MVSLTLEIKTTRDIGRQILRHRSFSFQEFSQRYAEVVDMTSNREARLQDKKNRQNSIDIDDEDELQRDFTAMQKQIELNAAFYYKHFLQRGIAKEQARVLLPEGLTMSTMFVHGTLRSWLHYIDLRRKNGTQKEHMDIAIKAMKIVSEEFPSVAGAMGWVEEQ